ncbi:MAG: hypothetical protein AAFW74_14910, partial [Pseudomonadota bacterium]
GFALLIPPIRELLAAKIWKLIEPNVVTSTQWSSTHTSRDSNQPGGTVIDIEAVEIDDAAGNGAEKPGNTLGKQ